jgi:heat shock protein HslJ
MLPRLERTSGRITRSGSHDVPVKIGGWERLKLAPASLSLLLALALSAACGGGAGEASPGSLEGSPWVLRAGVDVDGWESVAPTATFADGTVTGSSGCNRYTASYTVDGDALGIGPIASTRMACEPPADAVEHEYLTALEQVAAWRLEDGELVLLDAGDAELLRYGPGPASDG